MLVEFSVANYRSFCERQTFSLVKAAGNELVEHNTFEVPPPARLKLLRSAAVYGPNAGGKSNFIKALQTMRQIVRYSAAKHTAGDLLPVTPFKLSESMQNEPSEFETTFVIDSVRYQYGFTATEERVCEEWLLAYPKGRARNWFTREWDAGRKAYDWSFGSALSGEKQAWQRSTRDNALFLSTAVQLNSKQLEPVYNWFSDTLHLAVSGWNYSFSASLCESEGEKARLLSFLREADIDIQDIQVESEEFDAERLPEEIPETLKDVIFEKMRGKQVLEIKTFHKGREGNPVPLEFGEESDGTIKLFALAGPWLDILRNGYVLFVDELHNHLHPKLVEMLVRLFHDEKSNPHNAQLIFTTHETSVLDQRLLRRDQVWFCEKNEDQATSLYPLTDFSPRKGRENLEDAYLSGKYGALPYVGHLRTTS